MLFSVLCTMLLGLCIMKREGRRVIMSLWRIVPCHCSARSGFPRLKPARVAFAPFARQKAFSFALMPSQSVSGHEGEKEKNPERTLQQEMCAHAL